MIEILQRPIDPKNNHSALDYRMPKGVFTGIKVWNIDELFNSYILKEIPFQQGIFNEPWGHRSFYVLEPDRLVLGLYQERF